MRQLFGKAKAGQVGLFDEHDLTTKDPVKDSVVIAARFRVVSQKVFLSWPEEAQLAYCMKRDLDSAETSEDLESSWYLARAESYRQELIQ